MAKQLTHLRIDRVDMVDKGANQHAHIVLFKRVEPLAKMEMMGMARTTAEVLETNARHEAWNKLRWAFMDSLESIAEHAEADVQAGMYLQAVEEFAAAARMVLGDMDMADTLYKRAETTLTEMLTVEKAGRVIAGQRLQRLKQAVAALQAIVMEAEPMADDKKDMAAMQKRAEDAEALTATLQAQVEAMTKRSEDLAAEVQKLAPVDPWAGVSTEVRKRIEDAEAKVAKAEAEVAKRDCIAIVKQYTALPMNADDDWELIHEANTRLSEPTRKRLFTLLDSAQEVAIKSALFKAIGSPQTRTTGTDAYTVMENKAKDLVSKGLVKTVAQGIDQVMLADPELYGQYLAEQKGA